MPRWTARLRVRFPLPLPPPRDRWGRAFTGPNMAKSKLLAPTQEQPYIARLSVGKIEHLRRKMKSLRSERDIPPLVNLRRFAAQGSGHESFGGLLIARESSEHRSLGKRSKRYCFSPCSAAFWAWWTRPPQSASLIFALSISSTCRCRFSTASVFKCCTF